MVLPRLQDFLEGRNQLIFAYGATCSGKTFTIQGDSVNPGILPRALDGKKFQFVLFLFRKSPQNFSSIPALHVSVVNI